MPNDNVIPLLSAQAQAKRFFSAQLEQLRAIRDNLTTSRQIYQRKDNHIGVAIEDAIATLEASLEQFTSIEDNLP